MKFIADKTVPYLKGILDSVILPQNNSAPARINVYISAIGKYVTLKKDLIRLCFGYLFLSL